MGTHISKGYKFPDLSKVHEIFHLGVSFAFGHCYFLGFMTNFKILDISKKIKIGVKFIITSYLLLGTKNFF
jgi:hypothetical protein